MAPIRERSAPSTVVVRNTMNDIVAPFSFSRKAPVTLTTSPSYGQAVEVQAVRVSENGAGTYVADILLPAGAFIIDIIVHNQVLWTAATSAAGEVGDFTNAATPVARDADGFFTAIDLKATDLLALESISLANAGGVEGAYSAGTLTHWEERWNAAERIIRMSIVSVGAGTAGRTYLVVVYTHLNAEMLREVTQ